MQVDGLHPNGANPLDKASQGLKSAAGARKGEPKPDGKSFADALGKAKAAGQPPAGQPAGDAARPGSGGGAGSGDAGDGKPHRPDPAEAAIRVLQLSKSRRRAVGEAFGLLRRRGVAGAVPVPFGGGDAALLALVTAEGSLAGFGDCLWVSALAPGRWDPVLGPLRSFARAPRTLPRSSRSAMAPERDRNRSGFRAVIRSCPSWYTGVDGEERSGWGWGMER